MDYLLVYSNKKLAFKNTVCQSCDQPIPIEKIRKEFLWDVNQYLKIQNPQIKDGTLDNNDFPIITLIFEDFNYEDESGYKNAIEDNLFQVARLSMGNYNNLGSIKNMEKTFYWFSRIQSLLQNHFSKQDYYYKIVTEYDEELLPLTTLLLEEE